jgi:Domain of unknown function (DUF1835)
MASKFAEIEPPPFAIADAVHLIRGSSAGGTLRQSGARFVIAAPDSLAYGPSSFDPVEHWGLRSAFWNEVSGSSSLEPEKAPIAAAELQAAVQAFPSGLPIVLWSGENWNDRLFLWWALDALSRTSLALRTIWLASPLCIHEWDFLESMGCYRPDQITEMFGRAHRFGPKTVKAASARWRLFCATTPRGLADIATTREPWFGLSTDYLRFFPRAISKALCVSEFDEVVLSGFSPKAWRRPLSLLSPERLTQHPVLLNHGDLLPLLRLDAWTVPRPLPVLLRRETGNERIYTRYEYRLTAHGARVLKHGLGNVAWAPPLSMGGHVAYDAKNPWVVRQMAAGWKLHSLAEA